jgi:hypothetical protein
VAGPTPHSADTGSGRRKASTPSSGTTFTPSPGRGPVGDALGLAASEASLATNLVGATPTEHVRCCSSKIRVRIWSAIDGAGPNSRSEPVTSRKASSRDRGSTNGVNDRKTPITWPLTSAYRSWRPGRKTACGHSRWARTDGMAENTP